MSRKTHLGAGMQTRKSGQKKKQYKKKKKQKWYKVSREEWV